MFAGAGSFHSDLSKWDVGSVVNMASMFNGSSFFGGDLSGWNVANVEFMDSMFESVFFFDSDISSWNVSNVKSMTSMFKYAISFNQSLCEWGQLLLEPGVVNVTEIFAASGCANTTEPSFAADSTTSGPWCQICNGSY